MAVKNVPASISNINILFIALHHPYAGENYQDTDNIPYRQIFMKDHHCPNLRPQQVHTLVGIRCGQGKLLYHLLPCNGIDSAVSDHQCQEHIKPDTSQPVPVILHGCHLGKYAGQGKQQNIQVKLYVILYFFHCFFLLFFLYIVFTSDTISSYYTILIRQLQEIF